MAFSYNGLIYRDLEDQVRYDAEQVQLLKQADVEINESLQTVNTEINGKLNKPTNPSAESAVTMLADGTVGTKLLSEIGGGGGKLYRHDIHISANSVGDLYMTFYTPNSTLIDTMGKIAANSATGKINCVYSGVKGTGSVAFFAYSTYFYIYGVVISHNGTTSGYVNYESIIPTQITDTATEL